MKCPKCQEELWGADLCVNKQCEWYHEAEKGYSKTISMYQAREHRKYVDGLKDTVTRRNKQIDRLKSEIIGWKAANKALEELIVNFENCNL